MWTIIKGKPEDALALTELGRVTFMESHGHCASEIEVNEYLNTHFIYEKFLFELKDDKNLFYLTVDEGQLIGYSKIIFNCSNPNHTGSEITKLERLYVLKEHHGTGIAKQLFDFNVQLAKDHSQKGIWLNVWVENERAIQFYRKKGFKDIGSYSFKISENHSNPNHVMYMEL